MIPIKNFLENIPKYIEKDKTPFIMGIAGGSGSGKGLISEKISEVFQGFILRMDDYYKRGGVPEKDGLNYDLPNSIDLELIRKHLISLKKSGRITKPVYTFALKKDYSETVEPKPVIILEGLFALNSEFVDLLDFKIFIDSSEEVRQERRLKRDSEERGYSKEHTKKIWKNKVEPMYKKYVLPQKDKADLVIDSNKNLNKS